MPSPIGFSATPTSTAGGSAAPKLEHAYFEVRDPPSSSAATPGGVRGRIDFQFNPKELKIAKTAKWKRETQRNKKSSGVPEYGGADPVKLSLDMFLDATDKMDDAVVKAVEKLFELVVPTSQSLAAGKGMPPAVIFRWGGLAGFAAVVSNVSVTYTLFTPSGMPVRGTAQVTLEEITPEHPPQNPTSGSPYPQATAVLVEGDTLQSLAHREYGDPNRWRDLAVANRIDDPLAVRPGMTVLLPAATDLERTR